MKKRSLQNKIIATAAITGLLAGTTSMGVHYLISHKKFGHSNGCPNGCPASQTASSNKTGESNSCPNGCPSREAASEKKKGEPNGCPNGCPGHQ